MALYLEGKTSLTRMIFPSRRQLHESRQQVYRHRRAQGSDCDRRPEWQREAATKASCGPGPFRDFYVALLAKGMKPEMARLTLARKIAAITLTLWKKEERFDAAQLKPQAA